MALLQKQHLFTRLVCELLTHLHEQGYEVTFGETWRPPETAYLYSKEGKGIPNSLHCMRLAIDLNLWKDGEWLKRSEDYAAVGKFWESLSSAEAKCCWGGAFGDGNHFSVEHNGVR